MSVKSQNLERLKTKLKKQGYGFSSGLKQSFVTGDLPTFPKDLSSANIDQLPPGYSAPSIINNTRPRLRHRPLRTPKHIQQGLDTNSQLSLTVQNHEPDTAAIFEKLDPLLLQIQQQTTIHDSQLLHQGRSAMFRKLLNLSTDEIKVACDHIDFDLWTDGVLVDLCDAFEGMENLAYPVACTVIRASLYPFVLKLTNSTSRLLMNSILQLGTSFGNVILNALILPLLEVCHIGQTQIGRPQLELILKLITGSLNVSSRTTFLRFLLSGVEDGASNDRPVAATSTAQSDTNLQLMNTLATSSNPFISMDGTMIRQLVQASHQIVQARPKDKTCMQLLLTLTSKHKQALVDTNLLDDLEAVANQSEMFLKRSVLGQLATIRKKTAQK